MTTLIQIAIGIALLGAAAALVLGRSTVRRGVVWLMQAATGWTEKEIGIWPAVFVLWSAGILAACGLLYVGGRMSAW